MEEKEPLVRNAADPDQVKNAKARVKRTREREIQDITWVLSTKMGRRFFWRYLEMTGLFRTSMDAAMNRTFFNEGERNVGLRLMADLDEAQPEAFILMKKESKEE